MTIDQYYTNAAKATSFSRKIFWTILVLTVVLLFDTSGKAAGGIVPFLIVFSIVGVILGAVARYCQTSGNDARRDSQLTHAFDCPIGEPPKPGYYNNDLPLGIQRLAATTLENTRFTIAVIEESIQVRRTEVLLYLIIFGLLLGFRQASLAWLLVACQSIFSAHVVLRWYSVERLLSRTRTARARLRQHFVAVAQESSKLSTPIVLSTFAQYECAKDDAAYSLSRDDFERINAVESKLWEEEKAALGIQ